VPYEYHVKHVTGSWVCISEGGYNTSGVYEQALKDDSLKIAIMGLY
jgi:hypothetical protein